MKLLQRNVSRETFPSRLIVVATGTNVGKTHTALSLIHAATALGIPVAGLKPIESGILSSGSSDFGRLSATSTFHVKPPPYAFPDPVSPHLAARRAETSISLRTVQRWVDAHRGPCIIETAGALLSPLAKGVTNLDLLAALLPAHVVLVAPDRLGVLHDVGACQLALRALMRQEVVVALQPPESPDPSSGTNAEELRYLSIACTVIQYPRADCASPASLQAAMALLEFLRTAAPSKARKPPRRKPP